MEGYKYIIGLIMNWLVNMYRHKMEEIIFFYAYMYSGKSISKMKAIKICSNKY